MSDGIDPILAGLLSGRLVGWHQEAGELVPGLADWHADALDLPTDHPARTGERPSCEQDIPRGMKSRPREFMPWWATREVRARHFARNNRTRTRCRPGVE